MVQFNGAFDFRPIRSVIPYHSMSSSCQGVSERFVHSLRLRCLLPFLGLGPRFPSGCLPGGMIQTGIPAQPRYHRCPHTYTGPPQTDRSQSAIDDQHQQTLRKPAMHLLEHLSNPVDAGLVTLCITVGILGLSPTNLLFLLLFCGRILALPALFRRRRLLFFGRERQHRQKRQRPRSITPRQRHQQHHRDPFQSETANHMRLARSHRISVTTQMADLFPPASFHGIISPDHQWMSDGNERADQQP